MPYYSSPIERVAACSIPEPNSGCWLWLLSLNSSGYGGVNLTRAHRYSFEAHVGEIPRGLQVLHKCDQRSCVNPDHLFLGTNLDNVLDKLAKGRQPNGSSINTSKLSEEDVLGIRKSNTKAYTLAKEYGVSPQTIYDILRRKTWKHLS